MMMMAILAKNSEQRPVDAKSVVSTVGRRQQTLYFGTSQSRCQGWTRTLIFIAIGSLDFLMHALLD